MIKFTPAEWSKLRERLLNEYPRSFILISWVCKRELGFTVRDHSTYADQYGNGTAHTIYLDFYDDAKETWFRLKYL